MKIGINLTGLSPKHGGGKDQAVFNLLTGFKQLGYEKKIQIFCFQYSTDVLKNILPQAKIIAIHSPFKKNEALRMAFCAFVNTFILPSKERVANLDVLFYANCNTGIGHVQGVPSVVMPADIKAVSHRVLGKLKIPYYKYIIYKIIYFVDVKYNDYIISMCKFDEDQLTKYYPNAQGKTKIISIPVVSKSPLRIRTIGKKYIIALNLQFHHKNIITLIKAFNRIKNTIPQNLVLIGAVPPRVQYLKDYVKEHELEDRVVFTSFIDDEGKYQFFEDCILYVNPTLYEGFGMTAVEAMIMQVPTLISDVTANREVTHGLCRYYLPADDEVSLANSILESIHNPPQLAEREYYSKEMEKTYDMLRISAEYISFFKSICQQDKK